MGESTSYERKIVWRDVPMTPPEHCLFLARWRNKLVDSYTLTAARADEGGFYRIAAAALDLAAEYQAVAEAAVVASQDPITAVAFIAEFEIAKAFPTIRLDVLALARRLDYEEPDYAFDDINPEAAERLAALINEAVAGPCETLTVEEVARRL